MDKKFNLKIKYTNELMLFKKNKIESQFLSCLTGKKYVLWVLKNSSLLAYSWIIVFLDWLKGAVKIWCTLQVSNAMLNWIIITVLNRKWSFSLND